MHINEETGHPVN